MKKIIKISIVCLIVIMITIFMTGCGNMSFSLGNYNFTKVHIIGNHCEEISEWHDNELGCEVRMTHGGSIHLSEGTYILIEDRCPICDVEE